MSQLVCNITWLIVLGGLSSASAADLYEVDSVHSSVVFRIRHLNVSYAYGRFNDISGQFMFDEADPAKSRIDVSVKVESIDTANTDRDKHLKSAEFFNVAEHPTIAFKSSRVEKLADNKYRAEGELTLMGVTKPLTVELERVGSVDHPKLGARSGFETVFTIKRGDFGLNAAAGMLGEDVRLMVSIEGVRAQKPGPN
ncbi:MAG: YceI family protein [Phycisphaerae bacterium]